MDRSPTGGGAESDLDLDGVNTVEELARVLRMLHRRYAQVRRETKLTLRELAARTGYAHGVVGDYLNGRRLPPIDRFDVLIVLLGATREEQRLLAKVHERVDEAVRHSQTIDGHTAPAVPVEASSRMAKSPMPQELPASVYSFTGGTAEFEQLVGKDLAAESISSTGGRRRVLGGLPAVWNVPVRNPAFVGRDRMLQQLRERLRSGRHAVVQALHGMGGVGKTQLAIEYAHRYAAEYDLVWWLDSEQVGLVGEQIAGLAIALDIETGAALRCKVGHPATRPAGHFRLDFLLQQQKTPLHTGLRMPSGLREPPTLNHYAGSGRMKPGLHLHG